MDFALTEDQLRFKEAAREFLTKEVVPYRAEWDRRSPSIPRSRVMTLYEGTSQIQKLLIGRAETGVSAF